jgi:hypothetical protein
MLSEALRRKALDRQYWAVNALYKEGGTLATLLGSSYGLMRGGSESYAVFVTPGFADLLNRVPIGIQERNLRQISHLATVFNKRLLGIKLGCPQGVSAEIGKEVAAINDITEAVISECSGELVDLTGLEYLPWEDSIGSRPVDMEEVAACMAEAVLNSHSGIQRWRDQN